MSELEACQTTETVSVDPSGSVPINEPEACQATETVSVDPSESVPINEPEACQTTETVSVDPSESVPINEPEACQTTETVSVDPTESVPINLSCMKGKKYSLSGTCPIKRMDMWTLRQKKRLLSLLAEYPLDAYTSIARKIVEKDEEQVKEYILRLKQIIKNKQQVKRVKKGVVQRAPLEEWLEISTEMVEFESVDSSANLAKVMSVISNFEDFQTVELEGSRGPDYKSIYKFLSQILQYDRREDIIQLQPIESAIVLDMLHNLMEILGENDTTVQRNIMKWKHQLMSARDQNGHSVPEILKKASENDFSDFINEARMNRNKELADERRYMAKRAGASQGNSTKKSKDKVSATATSRENTEPTSREAGTSSETLFAEKLILAEEEGDPVDKPPIKKHKPGRKGVLDPPEIPRTEIVLVMPPKGVEIVNYNPRAKIPLTQRSDGKYQSLNPEEQLISNDLSREVTYDVHRSELLQFQSAKGAVGRLSMDERIRRLEREQEMDEKYEHVMKSEEELTKDIPVKKPKLYSLNPFCLPVTLLDIDT